MAEIGGIGGSSRWSHVASIPSLLCTALADAMHFSSGRLILPAGFSLGKHAAALTLILAAYLTPPRCDTAERIIAIFGSLLDRSHFPELLSLYHLPSSSIISQEVPGRSFRETSFSSYVQRNILSASI